jgi:hypothetical protein
VAGGPAPGGGGLGPVSGRRIWASIAACTHSARAGRSWHNEWWGGAGVTSGGPLGDGWLDGAGGRAASGSGAARMQAGGGGAVLLFLQFMSGAVWVRGRGKGCHVYEIFTFIGPLVHSSVNQ